MKLREEDPLRLVLLQTVEEFSKVCKALYLQSLFFNQITMIVQLQNQQNV